MAQYNRPPKQKAPKADEFISFFDHLIIYFAKHRQRLLVLVVSVVLALGVYSLYRLYIGREVQRFAAEYMQAEQASASEGLESWEKLKAKNLPAYLDELVVMHMGGDYVEKQQWSEAAKAFGGNQSSSSFLLKTINQLSYATSLENAGQYSQAKEIYQNLSEEKDSPFQFEGRLGMARCLVGMNQVNDAETILLQLIAKDSEASQAVKSAALTKLIAMRVQSK